MLQTLKGTRRL